MDNNHANVAQPLTRYQVEFQAACVCCKRRVDVVSMRIPGQAKEAGLVYSRHLAPRRVGEIRGLCSSSMVVVTRV